MYCFKCGQVNEDTARFCGRCGAPLEAQVSEMQTPGSIGVGTDNVQALKRFLTPGGILTLVSAMILLASEYVGWHYTYKYNPLLAFMARESKIEDLARGYLECESRIFKDAWAYHVISICVAMMIIAAVAARLLHRRRLVIVMMVLVGLLAGWQLLRGAAMQLGNFSQFAGDWGIAPSMGYYVRLAALILFIVSCCIRDRENSIRQ